MTTPERTYTGTSNAANEEFIANVQARRGGEAVEVTFAKRELAPTRASALADLEEFRQLVTRHTPAFDDAFNLFLHACKVGVGHYPDSTAVHNLVMNARNLMLGGVASLQSIPVEIDNLTEYVVFQNGALRIEGRYKMARECHAALESLAKSLSHAVAQMQARIDRAPRAPVTKVGYNNDLWSGGEIKVVTDFKL